MILRRLARKIGHLEILISDKLIIQDNNTNRLKHKGSEYSREREKNSLGEYLYPVDSISYNCQLEI